jgi:hypothetical protein
MIEEASVGVEEHLEKPMDFKRNQNISVNTTSVNRQRDFRGDAILQKLRLWSFEKPHKKSRKRMFLMIYDKTSLTTSGDDEYLLLKS